MFDVLQHLDTLLFLKINKEWTHPLFSEIFPILTELHKNQIFLFGILPAGLVFWFYRSRKKSLRCFLAMALAIGIADNFNHRILKNTFKRVRPNQSQAVPALLRTSYSPSGYSFPSNHAANNFAGARILSAFYPQYGFIYFGVAALIAYSRPYVGVHYPADIVMGGIVGFILAQLLLIFVFRKIDWFGLEEDEGPFT